MISDLLRGAGIRYVRRFNAEVLGDAADLTTFLFGSERAGLGEYRPLLVDVQQGVCFYCRRPLGASADVDHFIPWARYPTDLGHNFVLAHSGCNRSKSDNLAAEPHLEAWLERNALYGGALGCRFDEAGVAHDLVATLGVARWAYAQTAAAGGQVWAGGRTLTSLSDLWAELLPS